MGKKYNINPESHYVRLDNGHVFSGRQIIKLLSIACDELQAVILLTIRETDLPITNPDSDYGI